MPHLTLEALARLVDEAPTTDEAAHLHGCEQCRGELDALRDQTEALSAMPKMAPPPDLWPALRTRLRAEGLVAGSTPPRAYPALTRAAAALVLFVAGGAAGYAVRGPAETAVPAAAVTARTEGPARAAAPVTTLAGSDVSADVERAQEAFAAALDRYMMANSSEPPDPAARLAALDNIVMTTAEALNESPGDAVINSYHLTAVAQRNELLRQIAASGDPVF
jgi:hypothetical protein